MKKIIDIELQEMLAAGKTQKACAEHFGVSTPAICQRLKKLQSFKNPESFKKLTSKEKAFVKAKVAGASNQVAVRSAYDVTTNDSAKSIGTRLMKDPDISAAISDIMYSEGIGKRRRIQRLRDIIESHDLSVASRGVDMGFKLAGDYAPQEVNIVSDEQIRALIALVQVDQTKEDQ